MTQRAGFPAMTQEEQAQLEMTFMTGMVLHHREAIEMARMALASAVHPELKALAQRIVDAQQGEIETMGRWLRDWYGSELPPGTSMPPEIMRRFEMPIMAGLMPDMPARMAALETKSGAEFEIEFMSGMVDHHAIAIMMAAPVLIAGHHEDLYTLAEQIVMGQGQEMRQLDE